MLEYGLFFLNCYEWCKFPFTQWRVDIILSKEPVFLFFPTLMHLSRSINRVGSQPELICTPPFLKYATKVKLPTGAWRQTTRPLHKLKCTACIYDCIIFSQFAFAWCCFCIVGHFEWFSKSSLTHSSNTVIIFECICIFDKSIKPSFNQYQHM
jgi:hypothetical protein